MSNVKNSEVIQAWVLGMPAKNHRGSLTTDGSRLWSYKLLIGDTCSDTSLKVVKDYTAKGRGFRSQTTSCHVGLASRKADITD